MSHIAKEDVDRTYYLRVFNDLGTEEFAVRISTMDEPAGKSYIKSLRNKFCFISSFNQKFTFLPYI